MSAFSAFPSAPKSVLARNPFTALDWLVDKARVAKSVAGDVFYGLSKFGLFFVRHRFPKGDSHYHFSHQRESNQQTPTYAPHKATIRPCQVCLSPKSLAGSAVPR